MVYCGKPSGGCYACRQRKSRCDKAPGGCGQCKRMKRECPGYRQLGDVIFHDVSEKVVKKAKAKEARAKAKQELLGSNGQANARAGTQAFNQQLLEAGTLALSGGQNVSLSLGSACVEASYSKNLGDMILQPPKEQLADMIFMANFVYRVDEERLQGRFDYISNRFIQYSDDKGLLACIRAVGFAVSAHWHKQPGLLVHARAQYTQAIKYTNVALASNQLAKLDSTLMSILILGVYETITGTQHKSIQDWAQHIKGASAVIALRGKEQAMTIEGAYMLLEVANSLMVACVGQGKAFPQFMCDYLETIYESAPGPNHTFTIQQTLVKAINLRAMVLDGDFTDLQVVFDEAVELDRSITAMFQDVPLDWRYETVHTTEESPHLWKGKYHVYTDCWRALEWNRYRMARSLTNELIRYIIFLGASYDPPLLPIEVQDARIAQVTAVLSQLQEDILSSVPQHLYVLPQPSDIRRAAQAHTDTNGESTIDPNALRLAQADIRQQPQRDASTDQFSRSATKTLSDTPIHKSAGLPSLSTIPFRDRPPPLHPKPVQPLQNMIISSSPPPSKRSISPIPMSVTSPPLVATSPQLTQRKETPAARNYGANCLMWMLLYAGAMDISTQEAKAFAARNLREIAIENGIRQGCFLADFLEDRAPYYDVIAAM